MKSGEAGNVLIADVRNLTKYGMKILMLGSNPIGDNLAYILPMSAVIHQEGHELDCMMPNKQIFNLFSDMPYFTNLIQVPIIGHKASEERIREFVEFLPQYDKVFVCSRGVYVRIRQIVGEELMKNIDPRIEPESETDFWPIEILGRFGIKYKYSYSRLDMNWYKPFYHDFGCKSNSVLVNTKSNVAVRTYNKGDELKWLLKKSGYDIYEVDVNQDIRYNLHLVNQVRHVLTVDTGTFWMAKSLGKEIHTFFHRRFTEDLLGQKSLVPLQPSLSDISPQVIVDYFVHKTKKLYL